MKYEIIRLCVALLAPCHNSVATDLIKMIVIFILLIGFLQAQIDDGKITANVLGKYVSHGMKYLGK